MTKGILTSAEKKVTVITLTEERRLEQERIKEERMRDVLLLLENLVEREEATVKIIIDCLYDVGSVNLINQKFRSRILNGTMKSIAKMSKPVFRVFALRWFKQNCPQLVTNWLYRKVSFQNK